MTRGKSFCKYFETIKGKKLRRTSAPATARAGALSGRTSACPGSAAGVVPARRPISGDVSARRRPGAARCGRQGLPTARSAARNRGSCRCSVRLCSRPRQRPACGHTLRLRHAARRTRRSGSRLAAGLSTARCWPAVATRGFRGGLRHFRFLHSQKVSFFTTYAFPKIIVRHCVYTGTGAGDFTSPSASVAVKGSGR